MVPSALPLYSAKKMPWKGEEKAMVTEVEQKANVLVPLSDDVWFCQLPTVTNS